MVIKFEPQIEKFGVFVFVHMHPAWPVCVCCGGQFFLGLEWCVLLGCFLPWLRLLQKERKSCCYFTWRTISHSQDPAARETAARAASHLRKLILPKKLIAFL